MKGIIFRELIQMMEDKFGLETTDDVLEKSELTTKGAYTNIGTYNYREVLTIALSLSQKVGLPVGGLVKQFGRHMHKVFVEKYPTFFIEHNSSFEFLHSLDSYIHREVRKLYPDAELPKFNAERVDADTLVLTYSSHRPFADLAEGLILANVEHYKEAITVHSEDLSNGKGTARKFILKKCR